MKIEMKTPEQWSKTMRQRGEVTKPAGTILIVRQIQEDALRYAANLCVDHAETGNRGGWTESVSRECADIINAKVKE